MLVFSENPFRPLEEPDAGISDCGFVVFWIVALGVFPSSRLGLDVL